jgi:hypothetical protein
VETGSVGRHRRLEIVMSPHFLSMVSPGSGTWLPPSAASEMLGRTAGKPVARHGPDRQDPARAF